MQIRSDVPLTLQCTAHLNNFHCIIQLCAILDFVCSALSPYNSMPHNTHQCKLGIYQCIERKHILFTIAHLHNCKVGKFCSTFQECDARHAGNSKCARKESVDEGEDNSSSTRRHSLASIIIIIWEQKAARLKIRKK